MSLVWLDLGLNPDLKTCSPKKIAMLFYFRFHSFIVVEFGDKWYLIILVFIEWCSIRNNKVLCFDLLTRPKMPFKVMHRKEVTHSNGSYERKSRGQKLADEMGQAKKFPWYTTEWCTGREWPLNCMTVISAWWRLNIWFQRSSGHWTII